MSIKFQQKSAANKSDNGTQYSSCEDRSYTQTFPCIQWVTTT